MCIFAGYAWDCCFVLECLHWTLQPGPSELDIVSLSDLVLLGCWVQQMYFVPCYLAIQQCLDRLR